MRRRFGANEIAREAPVGWPLPPWHRYRDPFKLLPSALAALSALNHDPHAAAAILAMVALSVLMRFARESRSQGAAQALRGRVGNQATVLRPLRAVTRRRCKLGSPVEPLAARRTRSNCRSNHWCRAT